MKKSTCTHCYFIEVHVDLVSVDLSVCIHTNYRPRLTQPGIGYPYRTLDTSQPCFQVHLAAILYSILHYPQLFHRYSLAIPVTTYSCNYSVIPLYQS